MDELMRPKVGVGLLIIKDGSILLGQRKSSHGEGEFGGPGGHLEQNESFEECILRELSEEAGDEIKVKNLGFLCVTNMMKYPPKHYVDIGMVAEWDGGDPIVMEPHKLVSWNWYPIDALPEKLFGCMENYLEAHKTGQSYFPTA